LVFCFRRRNSGGVSPLPSFKLTVPSLGNTRLRSSAS
ncbi:hypothetical protein LINPERPRIM_LOCUS22262, partial [Linum perenne]